MVRLEDPEALVSRSSVTFPQIINCLRIHNVPALNFVIITILASFLLKLTTKYRELYMKSSLITTVVTNLVLYGISETLAQSILSFNIEAPVMSFSLRVSDASLPVSLPSRDGAGSPQPNRPVEFGEDLESGGESDAESVDEENLDRFLNYLRGSDSHLPYSSTVDLIGEPAAYPLSYFNFSRLAGFMCWGFIMAFVQCWWYKFLQIYSQHPQFIEVLRKVMSDQFCFSPISLFCFFTYGTMVLESGTWEDTKAKLQKLYLSTLIITYCVWFPVQFINFLLVPRAFQVPFSSSISVLWNCFLSMRNSTA